MRSVTEARKLRIIPVRFIAEIEGDLGGKAVRAWVGRGSVEHALGANGGGAFCIHFSTGGGPETPRGGPGMTRAGFLRAACGRARNSAAIEEGIGKFPRRRARRARGRYMDHGADPRNGPTLLRGPEGARVGGGRGRRGPGELGWAAGNEGVEGFPRQSKSVSGLFGYRWVEYSGFGAGCHVGAGSLCVGAAGGGGLRPAGLERLGSWVGGPAGCALPLSRNAGGLTRDGEILRW